MSSNRVWGKAEDLWDGKEYHVVNSETLLNTCNVPAKDQKGQRRGKEECQRSKKRERKRPGENQRKSVFFCVSIHLTFLVWTMSSRLGGGTRKEKARAFWLTYSGVRTGGGLMGGNLSASSGGLPVE